MSVKILKYIFLELVRSKFILIYTAFLFTFSFAVIYIGHDTAKAVVTLLNISLFVVPLVSLIFGTIHFYNSGEYIQLLLTQPVNRRSIFLAEYFGLSFSLSAAFLAGAGLPLLIYGLSISAALLLFTGVMLTFIFVSLSFLSSVLNKDKVKGIGLSVIIWLVMSLIYDGLILVILFAFSEYPLEKFILILTTLNPVDLSRILILLQLDISALMGFTGALFRDFFGSITGMVTALILLLLWAALPGLAALKVFSKKNF
ncbi:MAG: ABC transporter permease subunit [Ignavibacteria bacterium]|nr:ABC transporter permease subunit [Ignavibacteria bacterium]